MTAPSSPSDKSKTSRYQREAQVDFRMEATKQYSIRHAAAIAVASVEQMLACAPTPSQTVALSRQLNQLKRTVLRSESFFLEALAHMEDDHKVSTLFELFDKDSGGSISSDELARAFSRMDNTMSFKESLNAAVVSIAAYDINDDGQMDIYEFKDFFLNLAREMECNIQEFAEFLALRVGFADTGAGVLDEAVVALVQDSTNKANRKEGFQDAVTEVRMIMIFQLLDWQGTGTIPISDVVKSLKEVTGHMDSIPRKALLMCEQDSSIVLDYPQFSSLLLNVLSASSLKFHQIANLITLTICNNQNEQKKESLAKIFQKHDIDKIATGASRFAEADNAIQNQRITRLFDLWDLDHSGYLDLSELVLGLRKFHNTKDMGETVKECAAAMTSFDDNNDQQLDQHEFGAFLARFADAASVPLHELVDFMLIEFVTKDNSEEELDSVQKTIKAQARTLNRDSLHRVGFGSRRLWTSLTRA